MISISPLFFIFEVASKDATLFVVVMQFCAGD